MRRYLFLLLAITCFIVLIAIFVFGGYMGVFDTLYITSGANQLVLGTDELMHSESTPSYDYRLERQITWGIKTSFTYELENRRLSPYETHIEVTLWGQNQPGPLLLLSQDIRVEPFEKTELEWSIDPQDLGSRGFQAGLYTLRINREGADRSIFMTTYTTFPAKPYPMPVPALPPQ